jgi:hypothetical protein
MLARPLPVHSGEEAVRFVRSLGVHRYLKGQLHLVHALAFDAVSEAGDGGSPPPDLAEACRWAARTLSDPSIEQDSKDPRLYRQASLAELTAVLEGFWVPGRTADRASERLLDAIYRLGVEISAHAPFDEAAEDDMHPMLVDAGWELLRLADLDAVRHRGVIEAYGDPIDFEAARFEEENAIPARVTLQELPALGAVELLRGVDADGELVEPLVLWTEGDDAYHDYLLRGVARASRVGQPGS